MEFWTVIMHNKGYTCRHTCIMRVVCMCLAVVQECGSYPINYQGGENVKLHDIWKEGKGREKIWEDGHKTEHLGCWQTYPYGSPTSPPLPPHPHCNPTPILEQCVLWTHICQFHSVSINVTCFGFPPTRYYKCFSMINIIIQCTMRCSHVFQWYVSWIGAQ